MPDFGCRVIALPAGIRPPLRSAGLKASAIATVIETIFCLIWLAVVTRTTKM
jgi:hypothetical protein